MMSETHNDLNGRDDTFFNEFDWVSSRVTTSYTYDADGNRIKSVIGSNTTVYVGAIYEQTTSGSSTTITKYYQAGGQRIALRVNGVVRWLPIT